MEFFHEIAGDRVPLSCCEGLLAFARVNLGECRVWQFLLSAWERRDGRVMLAELNAGLLAIEGLGVCDDYS